MADRELYIKELDGSFVHIPGFKTKDPNYGNESSISGSGNLVLVNSKFVEGNCIITTERVADINILRQNLNTVSISDVTSHRDHRFITRN